MFAEDEADLLLGAADSPTHLDELVARRVTGEPLEHVVGWAGFGGQRVQVRPGVFVPRRRTEWLAELSLQAATQASPSPVVVELCCGTAAVATFVAAHAPQATVVASDLDPAAVACARINLEPFGGQVGQGDLYSALPESLRGRVDVLVANAPYVPSNEVDYLPIDARGYEPPLALFGGSDGLRVLRRVIHGASAWLAPKGTLLVECSAAQAITVVAEMGNHGLVGHIRADAARGATVVSGQRTD